VTKKHLSESGLEEWDLAAAQALDLGLVDIDTNDLVAQLGHASCVSSTEVAGTEDGNFFRHGV
jgi:hypothetical protein